MFSQSCLMPKLWQAQACSPSVRRKGDQQEGLIKMRWCPAVAPTPSPALPGPQSRHICSSRDIPGCMNSSLESFSLPTPPPEFRFLLPNFYLNLEV